jgi:signal peptidase I
MAKVSRQSVARVLDWGSNAVLALLLVAVLGALLAPHVLGWKYGILRSGSMSPGLPAGSAIVVAPAGAGDIAPGDVITYRSTNRQLLVTHRVVEVTSDEQGRTAFVTKGDANEGADQGTVTADRLFGKVVFGVPGVGYAVEQLSTRLAFYLLLVLPTLLIVALELRELRQGVIEQIEKRRNRGRPGSSSGGPEPSGSANTPSAAAGESPAMFSVATGPPALVPRARLPRGRPPGVRQRSKGAPAHAGLPSHDLLAIGAVSGVAAMAFAPGKLPLRLGFLLLLLLPLLVLGAGQLGETRRLGG